jgi:hypothetical protein
MRSDTESRTRLAREQRQGVLEVVEALANDAFPAGDLVVDDRGRERPVPRDNGREPRSGE